MPAVFGRHELQAGVLAEGGVIVDPERDKRVVLRGDKQGGHPDALQKLVGGLRPVILFRAAKSELWRGNAIVHFEDRADAAQITGAYRRAIAPDTKAAPPPFSAGSRSYCCRLGSAVCRA